MLSHLEFLPSGRLLYRTPVEVLRRWRITDLQRDNYLRQCWPRLARAIFRCTALYRPIPGACYSSSYFISIASGLDPMLRMSGECRNCGYVLCFREMRGKVRTL